MVCRDLLVLAVCLAPVSYVTPAVATDDLVGPSGALRTRSQAHDAGSPSVAGGGGGDADVPLGGTNEATVAVNPTNPLNVVYASLFELRASNDAGATFGPAVVNVVPPTHNAFFGGDPSLGFDAEGRLFWTYLAAINGEFDIFVSQSDPTTGFVLSGYPVNVTASPGVDLAAGTGLAHDKEWLAVDADADSPFAGSLYIAWTEFGDQGTRVLVTFSRDQGMSWGPAVRISEPDEGFPWPVHITVAPNGDVYLSYHSSAGGQILVVRSTDGGRTFPQKTMAFSPGDAEFTFNVQNGGAPIPGATFWLQGSAQAWVMADPNVEGRIYVVASDDPDNDLNSGDPADVFIAISDDHGATWAPPRRVDSGPGTTFQVMPTAAIDPDSGCIAIHYYDNRNGNLNSNGHFLLDVFATTSVDGGLTFAPDFQINDVPFDPDPGAPIRFSGPPPTTRIGEYNGIAIGGGLTHAVWAGNRMSGGNPTGQQTITDAFVCTECVPAECGDGNPCNGTEACDPDSGLCLQTLADCNENGIDDACDVSDCNGDPACSDCNANGVPDRCDLFGPFTTTSPELSPVVSGRSLNYELALPLEPAGDLTLAFAASADLGEATNGIEVQINGQLIGTVFGSEGPTCPLVPDTAELVLSLEEFNAIPSFGLYAIALIPFGDVSTSLCPFSFVTVTVRYETRTGPDCNNNNIPDDCEPDCQPNGIPDECELADGTVEDCQPNGVPDACDIASGTSADANGTGIPDECEPCVGNAECNETGVCEFGRCLDGVCQVTPALYGDVAGAGGLCGPDGSVDLADILAVLDGFAGVFRDGCEAVNMDIAGSEGSCTPDENIDLADILNVLDAFQGLDRCCAGQR